MPIKVEMLPHIAQRRPINIVQEITDQHIIFTDGSKSEAGVGAGYCYVLNDLVLKEAKFKLANYCSVFQADLFAIQCALKYINKNINNKSITISTDSQTMLKALKDVNSTTHLVYEIQKELTLAETK
jgi:ribonuclease HI